MKSGCSPSIFLLCFGIYICTRSLRLNFVCFHTVKIPFLFFLARLFGFSHFGGSARSPIGFALGFLPLLCA